MKILFVIDGLGTGGAERSLGEMLPGLTAGGVTPIITCLGHRAEGVEPILTRRFDVRFMTPSSLPARVRAMRRLIAREKPDLIHTTLFASHLVGRLSALGGPPVLSSLVNTQYAAARLSDPNINRWALRLVQSADGWSGRHLTDHFHAISNAVKGHAVEKLRISAERVTVVPRGRDPRRLGSASSERRLRARRAMGIPDDQQLIVNVGRQEFQKGQAHLLRAFHALLARRPEAMLVLAGREGAASHEIQAIVRGEDLSPRVRILGHRDDVPEVLAAADVFAFPSLFEGLGGVLIEAMALGLPIVASDIPAIREVVDDGRNALLVPHSDPGALAAALDHVLGDRQMMKSFGARGRQIFEERFTLERCTMRMLDLYRKLVPEPRTAQRIAG